MEKGFREAGRFLNAEKILWAPDLPYPAQAVALAAIFALAGEAARAALAAEKLRLCFWRTTLAEDSGISPESKLSTDTEEMTRWLKGGDEPERLRLLTFNPKRLETLSWRISAAYLGFSALLSPEFCRDFVTGQPADLMTFHNDPMDVHHIFPRKWCEAHGIDTKRSDSILNKTPLTAASNRMIGGDPPSRSLERIAHTCGLTPDHRDPILRSHLIEPAFFRADDFDTFLAERKAKLADRAARVMKTPLAAPAPPVEPEEQADEDALEQDAA